MLETLQHIISELHKKICHSWPTISQCSDTMLQTRMGMYPDKSGLKHIVLLPPVRECYSTTTIRNRSSFPLVYTMQGTFVGAMYTGECKHCSRKYHLSYYQETSDGSQTKRLMIQTRAKYFQITSQTVFGIALLNDITNNVSISAILFESGAAVYNENFQKIDGERLAELNNWYFRIVTKSTHGNLQKNVLKMHIRVHSSRFLQEQR